MDPIMAKQLTDYVRAYNDYRKKIPVAKPPHTPTYAPAVAQNFQSAYGPAAVVTLSDAARQFLRFLKTSEPR
jgi:hypothetical protein